MTVRYAWSPITKSEKQDDGTLLVYGPAASSALDRDGQKCDQAWLDQAMPAWMAEGGNVREQHDGKRAVGVGVGLAKGDDGAHLLTAHIVDSEAVKKCETGVLKGFSIGIKNPRVELGRADAPNGVITGGDIIEVSVVDRPANPECSITVAKSDDTGSLAYVEGAALVETPAPDPVSANADTGTDPAPADTPPVPPTEAAKSVDPETVLRAAEVIVRARPLVKADDMGDTADIATAQQAISIIAGLIISEAESLAKGNLGEACDISTLLRAVDALTWFQASESMEPDDSINLADTPDAAKADTPTDPAPAEGVLTKADLADLVKSAVAEATKADKERIDALAADLAKANGELDTLKAQPMPGGPVITRNAEQQDTARKSDANRLLMEADRYLAKADMVSDRDLRDGYRAKAMQLQAQAAA